MANGERRKAHGPLGLLTLLPYWAYLDGGNKEMEKQPMRRLQPPSTSRLFQVSNPSFPSSIASPLSKNSWGLRGGSTGMATVGGA